MLEDIMALTAALEK